MLTFLMILTSCVYYNTFYNAKKYYAEALNAKKQNNGNVSPSIDTKFETSIGKCAYIIQEYPTNKWVDDAILLMGQCYYEQEYYIKALRKFKEYEKYYSSRKLYPKAKLYLAKTYLAMKEYDEAMKQFSAIFTNPKFQEVRTEAYFDLTDYYLEKGKYNGAKNTILELLNTDLKKKNHLKAMFLYAQIVYTNGEYKSAELAFRNFLAEKPTKRYRLDALMYIGKIFIVTGNYNDAIQIFKNLHDNEVDYDKLPEIEMYIALCEAHLGKTEKAFEMFESINTENKGKKIVSEVNYYWGDIYFSVLRDYNNAIEKFNAVIIKNLDGALVNDTQNKLKVAQELISFQSVQNSDQIKQIVEFQFKLAEYYNFDLNQPDSALAMYDDILERLPLLRDELDSLTILLELTFPKEDSVDILSDTLLFADSLQITIESEIEDSIEIVQPVEDSVHAVAVDSMIIDSLRGIAIIDSSLSDSVLVDSVLTDSTLIEPEKPVLTRSQLLVKIENLHNMIHEFETEIIPKVLFMKLWTFKKKYDDPEMADEMYLRLETDYPGSKYTIAGKKLINNESYQLVEPREHFAHMYVQKALDFYFDSVTLEQSHAYLDTVISMYDSTSAYPQALYLKSYLFVKENHDTTAARPYLEEFFTDYPNHELKKEVTDFFDGTRFLSFEPEIDSSLIIDSMIVLPDSMNIADSLFVIDSTDVADSIGVTTQDSMFVIPANDNNLGGEKE